MAAPNNPSYVAVQPNSTGEAIDTTLVDYAPLNQNNVLVGRQVVALGDPNTAANVGSITGSGELRIYDQQLRDLIAQIVVQQQITNALLNLALPPQQQQNLNMMAAAYLALLNLPN